MYDLRQPVTIKTIMHQIPTANYCLANSSNLMLAAILKDPLSGRGMEVSTTAPGLQLYCGNYLAGKFMPFTGICLEPQYYPDSPNHAEFPSTFLKIGQKYDEQTCYKFYHSDSN